MAVIGESRAVAGYGLAGAEVVPAAGAEAVGAAWAGLADDTVLVVLTDRAAAALATMADPRPDILRVVVVP